jgi:hypothetical protein
MGLAKEGIKNFATDIRFVSIPSLWGERLAFSTIILLSGNLWTDLC